MELPIASLNKLAVRRIRKQAASCVMELHASGCTAAREEKVRRWIAKDPRHAAAFALATEAWKQSGDPRATLPERRGAALERVRPRVTGPAFAGMMALCVGLITAIYLLRDCVLVTGPSEQRTVELSDGTQVSLNANSRVVVQFDDRVRKVTLVRGEALFNVIKHQLRPFVVAVGARKVVALGTSFVVRREDPTGSAFAVTLVEGRVAIEPITWPNTWPITLPSESLSGLTLLNPGERLRFDGKAGEQKDSPAIERVTAWQRGQLIFDNTSLSEAAAEFNRYGTHKLVIDGTELGKLRIGGVFKISEPSSFALAMAKTFHLRILHRGDTTILTDKQADPQ